MNFQRILLNIAYWLVAISIVILIGMTFYARHIISGQSQKAVKNNTVTEEGTKIEFSGVSLTIDDDKAKKEVTEIQEAIRKDRGEKTDQN